MKRALLLVLVAVATFLLYVLYKDPGLLSDIWLWLIGLAGLIVKSTQSAIGYVGKLFQKPDRHDKKTIKEGEITATGKDGHEKPAIIDKSKTRLTLLRYRDDGEIAAGLLYLNENFYCYTIEDSAESVFSGKPGKIPSGSYKVDFETTTTPLTAMYTEQFPEWFSRHLQIINVPGLEKVYLYKGGNTIKNNGNIIVTDIPAITGENPFLTISPVTYQRLYKFLSEKLYDNREIMITIIDESWAGSLPLTI